MEVAVETVEGVGATTGTTTTKVKKSNPSSASWRLWSANGAMERSPPTHLLGEGGEAEGAAAGVGAAEAPPCCRTITRKRAENSISARVVVANSRTTAQPVFHPPANDKHGLEGCCYLFDHKLLIQIFPDPRRVPNRSEASDGEARRRRESDSIFADLTRLSAGGDPRLFLEKYRRLDIQRRCTQALGGSNSERLGRLRSELETPDALVFWHNWVLPKFKRDAEAGKRAEGRSPPLQGADVVLDLCSGMATTLLALLRAGFSVSLYTGVERDPAALLIAERLIRWCLERFPNQVRWSSVAQAFDAPEMGMITEEFVKDESFPATTILVATTPCPGFSSASNNPRGIDDPRSQLILDAVNIARWAGERNKDLEVLFENVVGIKVNAPATVDFILDELNLTECIMDCAVFAAAHRVRWFATSWPVPALKEEQPNASRWDAILASREDGRYSAQKCEWLDPSPQLAGNVLQHPVRKTSTFMFVDFETRAMTQRPRGSGRGLVHDAALGGQLVVPPPWAVAAAHNMPEGVVEGTPILTESAKRGACGNQVEARTLQYKFERLRACRAERASQGSGGQPPPGGDSPPPPPEEATQPGEGDEAQGNAAGGGEPEPDSRGDEGGEDSHLSDRSHETGRVTNADVNTPAGSPTQAVLLADGKEARLEASRGYAAQAAERGEDAAARSADPSTEEAEDGAEAQSDLDRLELGATGELKLPEASELPEGQASFSPPPAPTTTPAKERYPRMEGQQFVFCPGENPVDVRTAGNRMERAVRELHSLNAARRGATETPEQFMTMPHGVEGWARELRARSHDDANFRAFGYHRFAANWRRLFALMHELDLQPSKSSKAQRRVLKILTNGYKLSFQEVHLSATDGRPRGERRLRKVREILERAVGKGRVDEFLSGPTPTPIHFQNYKSLGDHMDFVRAERDALLATGALVRWWDLPTAVTRGEPPMVVSPMTVAYSVVKKKYRLCIDMRYVNAWLRYSPFHFERLQELLASIDLLQEVEGDAWVCLVDLKSGYHHVPLHPDSMGYCAISVDEELFAYPVLSFGMAQSVKAFSDVEEAKHRCARALGVPLTFMIDDCALVQGTRAMASKVQECLVDIGTALGCYFSWGELSVGATGEVSFAKVVVPARQRCEFLGITVDIPAHILSISEKKLNYFKEFATTLLANPANITPRDVARVAGMLLSYRPAIRVARLYCKALYMALTGITGWDSVLGASGALLESLRDWVGRIDRVNGKSWRPTPVALTLAGDASEYAGGAFVAEVQRSLSDGGSDPFGGPMVVSLPRELISESSTHRELWVVLQALRVAWERLGARLKGLAIRYVGDNQGACSVLEAMYSPTPGIHALVVDIWEFVLERGMMLYSHWQPRDTDLMVLADRYSKVPDNSAWELADRYVTRIWQWCGQHYGCTPDLDASADHLNKKCDKFLSRELCPGTSGVDMFAHGGLMAQHLCWVNGNFSRMADILCLIARYKIDCVLLYPAWPRSWRQTLERLPILAGPVEVPRAPDMCIPGPRVRSEQHGAPSYPLEVVVIRWPS